MTIKELITELSAFDENLKVGGQGENIGEYLCIKELNLIEYSNYINNFLAIKIENSQDID
jgi:hypothetical protein